MGARIDTSLQVKWPSPLVSVYWFHLCEHGREAVPNILQPNPDQPPKSKGWAGAGEVQGRGSESAAEGGEGAGGAGGGGLGGAAGIRTDAGVQGALLTMPVAGTLTVGARPVLRAQLTQRSNSEAPGKALQLARAGPAHGARLAVAVPRAPGH